MNIASIKQRPMRAYLADGLFDLYLGIGSLFVAAILSNMLASFAASGLAAYLLVMVVFIVVNKQTPKLRARYAYPRLGYVEPPRSIFYTSQDNSFDAKCARVFKCFVAAIATLIIVNLLHLQFWLAYDVLCGAAFAALLIDLYRRSGLMRYAFLAIPIVFAAAVLTFDPSALRWSNHGILFWLALAAMLIASGLFSFVTMLRMPVIAMEATQ